MNRSQLADAISELTGVSKIEVRKVLSAAESITVDALRGGDKLTLSGFGTFSVVHSAARMGRNPRTGAPVKINPKKNVKFRSTREL